ncbi:hypothetical protein [Chondromyces crocatus]|uniref:Uncharacterized protein n=1 Tax=Chondromyces crocatus TaxID=52 RepID=A0A0K1EME7_CHOCO|nr:hypothetical protein [Chondromyces crocatus]AKT42044.1 uncharacterized protein CMC5_062670 [Chondromyces crocatus]
MIPPRIIPLTILALSLPHLGCAGGTGEDMVDAFGDLSTEQFQQPMTGGQNGNGGNNGLRTAYFHANKSSLLSATGSRLPGPNHAPSVGVQALVSTEGGDKTLQYAVRCSVLDGQVVSYVDGVYGPKAYEGEGLLAGTSQWTTQGLSASQQEALFACMLAHLNPAGMVVPIALTGEMVAPAEDEEFDLSDYSFHEALWTATVSTAGGLIFKVWPIGDLRSSCSQVYLEGTLKNRTCGAVSQHASCGLEVRLDVEDDCTVSDGEYTCLGKPALVTRLIPEYFEQLHPLCIQ